MHEHWVVHRDLKLSNLLYHKGSLKICDFGLARHFGTPLRPYTPKVVTLWYRAPELLLGAKTYSWAVDMWSIGCIAAELLAHQPLLPGRNEAQQVDLMVELLGTPSDTIWPGFSQLPLASSFRFKHQPYNNISQRLSSLSSVCHTFLDNFLTFDPDRRPRARSALSAEYLRSGVRPSDAMPTFPTQTGGSGGGSTGAGGGKGDDGPAAKRSRRVGP